MMEMGNTNMKQAEKGGEKVEKFDHLWEYDRHMTESEWDIEYDCLSGICLEDVWKTR